MAMARLGAVEAERDAARSQLAALREAAIDLVRGIDESLDPGCPLCQIVFTEDGGANHDPDCYVDRLARGLTDTAAAAEAWERAVREAERAKVAEGRQRDSDLRDEAEQRRDQFRRERDAAQAECDLAKTQRDACREICAEYETGRRVPEFVQDQHEGSCEGLQELRARAEAERDALAKTLAEARLAMERALAERERILEMAQRAAAGPWHYASADLRLDAEADVRREAALLLWFRARAAEILGER
jgi:hypothetical protein